MFITESGRFRGSRCFLGLPLMAVLRLCSEDGQAYEFRRKLSLSPVDGAGHAPSGSIQQALPLGHYVSSTSLGARFFLLLVPLVTALYPTAAPAAGTGDFAGLVDIGGSREMYLKCRGKGSPTVVLVAGLKGSAEDWSNADKSAPTVFPEVAKFTRICAYDRPGTPVGEKPSRSDPVPQPTTAGDAVDDLHALLSVAGEVGPIVLVGHSYGGLVARLYASTYPEDVCGLVLVDALTEGLRDAETPDQWAIQRKLMEGEIRQSLVLYPALERVNVDRSFDQVRAAPPLRPLPPGRVVCGPTLGPSDPVDDRRRQAAG